MGEETAAGESGADAEAGAGLPLVVDDAVEESLNVVLNFSRTGAFSTSL